MKLKVNDREREKITRPTHLGHCKECGQDKDTIFRGYCKECRQAYGRQKGKETKRNGLESRVSQENIRLRLQVESLLRVLDSLGYNAQVFLRKRKELGRLPEDHATVEAILKDYGLVKVEKPSTYAFRGVEVSPELYKRVIDGNYEPED